MNGDNDPRQKQDQYVQARRVLLDALETLQNSP